MASIQLKTALAFLQTFQNLDSDANIELRTPGCRHTIAPASLNYTPNMTNEQWLAHFLPLKEVLAAFPVTAGEVLEGEASSQVTIRATSNAVFRKEAKDDEPGLDWSYEGEYMFMFVLNHAGDRIERIFEFVDSQKVCEVRVLIERAKSNIRQKKTNREVV